MKTARLANGGLPCLLAAVGLLTTAFSHLHAADEAWDELPNGVTGRISTFTAVGGGTIAGYVRKPAGVGPFPLVILLHGGAPTAKAVTAADEAERVKTAAAEAVRASRQLGRAQLSSGDRKWVLKDGKTLLATLKIEALYDKLQKEKVEGATVK
jgi:poly(3-hydroxybutyrate) depolymerase